MDTAFIPRTEEILKIVEMYLKKQGGWLTYVQPIVVVETQPYNHFIVIQYSGSVLASIVVFLLLMG